VKRLDTKQRWRLGGGVTVVAAVAFMLIGELWTQGAPLWNGALLVGMLGVLVAAFVVQRYLIDHIDEVGEARFDTGNTDHSNV